MQESRTNFLLDAVAASLFATCATLLAGCGTQPVGAMGDATTKATPEVASAPPAMSNARTTVARGPVRPGAKTVALERAGDRSYDRTFDDLRFDIQPGQPFHREMLPEAITAMAGQRIRIRGYILPTAQKRGIKTFVLVRDNQECCFGPGAALYDCILIEMKPGNTAEYSIRPVAVEGTFDIKEVKSGDMHLAIYHLDAESVH
jgi:hypothetical protein